MPQKEKDPILDELNKGLEPEEGEEPEEEEEEVVVEEKPAKKPREARFKGKDGKEKKVTNQPRKKKYSCPSCGAEESKRLDDGRTIYSYERELLSEVHRCSDCGRRFGVVKE